MTLAQVQRGLVELQRAGYVRVIDLDAGVARSLCRQLALFDVGVAYRRRVRIRGKGTRHGVGLAIAYFRRFALGSPMFQRRGRA